MVSLAAYDVDRSLIPFCRSPPFSVEDIGSVHFRLKEPGERSSSHLIRADIKMDYSTIFVTINLADDDWPFTVENDSSYDLSFCQMVGSLYLSTFKWLPTYSYLFLYAGSGARRRGCFKQNQPQLLLAGPYDDPIRMGLPRRR